MKTVLFTVVLSLVAASSLTFGAASERKDKMEARVEYFNTMPPHCKEIYFELLKEGSKYRGQYTDEAIYDRIDQYMVEYNRWDKDNNNGSMPCPIFDYNTI